MALPEHTDLSARANRPTMACDRDIRPRGMMRCCLDMLHTSWRVTGIGTEMECPACHGVVEVDGVGAWAWLPIATAERWRRWSEYG